MILSHSPLPSAAWMASLCFSRRISTRILILLRRASSLPPFTRHWTRPLPPRVVALSTIGAHVTEPTILKALFLLEQALRGLPMPVTFLRAGWFMENALWDIPPARERGVVPSFLQPLDKPVPMVATADIGRVAADLLRKANAPMVVELEGPRRITPNEIAAMLSRLLARNVRLEAVPRESWEALLRSRGATDSQLRLRMLDGFNEGWTEFEQDETHILKGTVEMETVLRTLIERA